MKHLLALLCIIFAAIPAHAEWSWDGPWFDVPPLDTPSMWARQLAADECRGCSANVLALVMDVKAAGKPARYPWPLFVQVSTDQAGGDAVGVYSRLYSDQKNGWASALHAEPFAKGANSTVIGLNVEPHNVSGQSRVIGAVLNAKEGEGEAAILITQDGGTWRTGIDLGGTGIDFGGGRVLKVSPDGRLCIYRRTGKVARCLTGKI